jgi:hypothetical protein
MRLRVLKDSGKQNRWRATTMTRGRMLYEAAFFLMLWAVVAGGAAALGQARPISLGALVTAVVAAILYSGWVDVG